MSGDKDSKKKPEETPAATSIPNTPAAMTFQPTLPGGIELLAQQLASGFGGQPSPFNAHLANMYKPVTLGTPAAQKPGTPMPANKPGSPPTAAQPGAFDWNKWQREQLGNR